MSYNLDTAGTVKWCSSISTGVESFACAMDHGHGVSSHEDYQHLLKDILSSTLAPVHGDTQIAEPTDPQEQSRFLSLPVEIRVMIYSYLARRSVDDVSVYYYREGTDCLQVKRPSYHGYSFIELMQTCRTVYHEVVSVIPRITNIAVSVPTDLGVIDSISCTFSADDYEQWGSDINHAHEMLTRWKVEPFQHVPAPCRQAKRATGRWSTDGEVEDWVRLMEMPSISYEVLRYNPFAWTHVEMEIAVAMQETYGDIPNVPLKTRLHEVLADVREWYEDIDNLVRFGKRDSDKLRVTVTFEIFDQDTEVLACVFSVSGGVVVNVTQYDNRLSEQDIKKVFGEVFDGEALE